jgi:UDP-N-acetylglucosamine 2-epimerase (non-hydrolysing)
MATVLTWLQSMIVLPLHGSALQFLDASKGSGKQGNLPIEDFGDSPLRKIAVVIGTRPEAIKLAPVIFALRSRPETFDVKVVATSQHREMLEQVLRLFNITPDYDLSIMLEDQDLYDVTSRALLGIKQVFQKEKPDVVVVQGDTTTTLTASLGAFYERSSVAHVEAGLRTGEKYSPFPEELNRKLTSVLTDYHFAPTLRAKANLLAEGCPESSIFVTGNTVIDALLWVLARIEQEPLKSQLEDRFSFLSSNRRLILVTAHRRESFGKPLDNICTAIKEIIAGNPDVEVVYPVHMNPNVNIPVRKSLGNVERVYLIEPVEYDSLVHLMKRCYLVLTDSGGIQEEAPTLKKPVLVLRQVTERPEAVEAGTAVVVGTDSTEIAEKAQILLRNPEEYAKMTATENPFGDGHAAERIAQILSGQHMP